MLEAIEEHAEQGVDALRLTQNAGSLYGKDSSRRQQKFGKLLAKIE